MADEQAQAAARSINGNPLGHAITQLARYDAESERRDVATDETIALAAVASALAQIAQAQQLKRIADALDVGDAAPFVVQVIP